MPHRACDDIIEYGTIWSHMNWLQIIRFYIIEYNTIQCIILANVTIHDTILSIQYSTIQDEPMQHNAIKYSSNQSTAIQ